MRATSKREIEELLKKYNNFSECVIEQIRWLHYGTTVEVVMNYIWTDEGQIRSDLDRADLVTLRFSLVQKMHIDNALNDSMVSEPEMINWGKNEVSMVRLFSEDVF